MDKPNMNSQSQYPDPELSQIQNIQPVQEINSDGLQPALKKPHIPPSLLDWQKQFRRSFDPAPLARSKIPSFEHTSQVSSRAQVPSTNYNGSAAVDWQSQFRRPSERPIASKNEHVINVSTEASVSSWTQKSIESRETGQRKHTNLPVELSHDNFSFDVSMGGMDEENTGNDWDRELPGDDMDDALDGDDDDPDYRDHSAKMKKLRNDILRLRNGDESVDTLAILDGAPLVRTRRKPQPKEPKPRGRQWGQKVGPRKAAELSGEMKLLLAKAVGLFQEQRTFEAAKALEEIVRLNAEVPTAWAILGGIYEDAGQIDRALRCAIMTAHTSPKSVDPWVSAAILAESQHGPERQYFLAQAQYCYTSAIRIAPKSLELRRARGAVLEERGKRNTAINEYRTIVAKEPLDTESLHKIAELCIDHGKPQIAIDAYKATIAHFQKLPPEEIGGFDWTQVDTYVTLYEVIGQYYSAISELKSLSRWLLGREADVFWKEITVNDCEWDTDEKRKIRVPGYVSGKHGAESYELPLELRVKLGVYRLRIEDRVEAMHHFNFLDPKDESGEQRVQEYPHLFNQAATDLFSKDMFDKALVFYEALLTVPDFYDSALLVQIGRCLLRLDQAALAEQTFRDAIELDDNNVDARMELAKIHENRNELHKALNFVNEAMLLRKGQKRSENVMTQNNYASEQDLEVEEGTDDLSEKLDRPKRKYIRRNIAARPAPLRSRLQPDHRLKVLSKGEELMNHYQTFKNQKDGMRDGNPSAVKAWLEAAKALTDDFRSCKAFYPWDKYIKFLGYSGEAALHAATPLDSDLSAIADRLSKNLGADLSLHRNHTNGNIPTTYRDLLFTEWNDIFMEYAISLAKNGFSQESYELCHAIEDSVVFYQTREDKFLTHLVHSVCALLSSDEEACVTQARYFMREYQFTTDSYRMYGALMRAIHSPVSWYSSGPSQKYILRQIKCMDLVLVDEHRRKKNNIGERGSYSATDENGHLIINDDMDICLLMMYGHILYVGQSYAYALNYFYRAYALDPENPMIHLCLGLSYCHHALKRQCENRQHHVLQGMSFMMRYHEARIKSEHLEERQEAHYNVARLYHMVGMVHLALPFYQKVLDEVKDGERSEREDITVDTAYNLQTMYALAGNMELAQEITRKWLVL